MFVSRFFLVTVVILPAICSIGLISARDEEERSNPLENERESISNNVRRRRRRRLMDPRTVVPKRNEHFADESTNAYTPEAPDKTYNVGDNYWCKPAQVPPIDYDSCDKSKVMNAIPLRAGLTNGLKFMNLSIIWSLERGNTCVYMDETNSIFPKHLGPFYENYFEPIGLPVDSQDVQTAIKRHRVEILPWEKVWIKSQDRRMQDTIHNIPALGYHNVEGHDLKWNMMKRIWRPIPRIRDNTCSKLEEYIKGEEYLVLSMREGDKTIEGFKFATMEQYIEKVEEVVPLHFDGKVPLIFVATDSCDPLDRLKQMKPEWRIVSECDRVQQHGYVLADQLKWTQAELDEHYEKFFVELFAMAGGKVWIGVTYTNVSWWVYFMREKTEEKTFYVLEGEGSGAVPQAW
mmetsp:Transcript_361/g.390  ORF Transcript_361/g.390 Transcript_361/m.390 type:complete len:403 (-) Transcript_361:154-1362(-)